MCKSIQVLDNPSLLATPVNKGFLFPLKKKRNPWQLFKIYHFICYLQADDISGFHANTHIPVVIGSQMRYEVTGDALYKVHYCCCSYICIHNQWWIDKQSLLLSVMLVHQNILNKFFSLVVVSLFFLSRASFISISVLCLISLEIVIGKEAAFYFSLIFFIFYFSFLKV